MCFVRFRRVCKGFALPPRTAPPSWDLNVRDTWEPRLRGECECTCISVRHVLRSLPAVVLFLHVCVLIHLKFCPKRNVLAQVPSVHGRFRSACCLCSTPAARLCAAWELGFSRTRTESAERKTSHRFVIGLGGSLTKSNCGAPLTLFNKMLEIVVFSCGL